MASREFWDDFKWGHQHHTELLKEHKDKWVAITNKQVVSSGKNLAEVERKARKKMKKEEIPLLYVDSGQFPFQQIL